jgi:hypothetical protein
VRAVFDAPSTTTVERKQLIRTVIAEIVLTVDADTRVAALRIIWQGGATTELSMAMTKRGGHTRTTDEDTIALVRRLAADYDDRSIAAILAKQGRRTASGLNWTKTRVAALRTSRGIPAHQPPPTPIVGQATKMASWSPSPGFRSCLIVWTRKRAAELRKRVIVDGQACVQGPAFPQVGAL